MLDEKDAEIIVATARIGLRICAERDRWFAIQRMIEALPSADSFVRAEARAGLSENFPIARPQVEAEILRRSRTNRREQARDVVLRLLVNLKWEMEGGPEGMKNYARPHK